MIYPSDLVLSALRFPPQGTPYQGPSTTCSHCGKPVHAGDVHQEVSVGEFFSDTRDLAAPTGLVCGGCAVLRSKKCMQALSFVVITGDAVYSIAKDDNRAWFLLTPPEPPFVAVVKTTTLMHLVWRTPVTLSRDLIWLRNGVHMLSIRPARLRTMTAMAADIQARRVAAGDTKAFASPFLMVDRQMRLPAHGQLSPRAREVMTPAEVEFFATLTTGEVWASSTLLKKEPPAPAQPQPSVIDLNSQEEEEIS